MTLRRAVVNSLSPSQSHTLHDHEFGTVLCKRTSARYVRVRVNEYGAVVATLPKRAPLRYVEQLLDSSREQIRELIHQQRAKLPVYTDGMQIGHSHRLFIERATVAAPKKKVAGQSLHIFLPETWYIEGDEARQYIVKQVKAVLRREAEAYLPRRLSYLAETFGFSYEKIRFGNPKGRWGSCSSSGTISLNVALMNTPHDVIDYVLIHELAHTRHMDHSAQFWSLVEDCLPDFKSPRKILKTMSPIC